MTPRKPTKKEREELESCIAKELSPDGKPVEESTRNMAYDLVEDSAVAVFDDCYVPSVDRPEYIGKMLVFVEHKVPMCTLLFIWPNGKIEAVE